jgi:hypothetical protein
MKPVLIALVAATVVGAAAPVAAQPLGGLVETVQYGRYYDDEPPAQVYRERRVYRDYGDDYEPRPRRRVFEEDGFTPRGPRRAGLGQVCTTSRGTCYTRPQPVGSRCGCDIPGFGPKRGAIAY